jgi:DNA-binding NtrC family response regulator
VEKRKADIRVIAATNKDLEAEVKKGNFRDDLYFRLNVVRLYVPPLRERREDILPLFRFFMARFNDQFQKRFGQISKEAEAYLLQYAWPGNVRELRNAAERVVLMEKGDTIFDRHFSFLTGKEKEEAKRSRASSAPYIPPQGIVWDDMEKTYLEEALRLKKGNKIQAAKLLGITRSAFLYRMEKHGLK